MDEKDSTTIRSAVINKAISYIFENIDEEITVDDVARHCSYSKYHLMRMFKEDTDEALYQFIKRVRLERSAWRLKVEKDKSITEIGVDYGYSSSNFTTAFKKHLNVTPADFRKLSEQMVERSSFAHGISLDELEESEKLITVEYLNSFMVVYERKKGNYHNLPEEWCKFIKKYEHLSSEDTLYIECTIDDPSITDEDRCMYELCQTISPILFMVYQEMFCRWLSKTGNQLDDYLDRSGIVRGMSGSPIIQDGKLVGAVTHVLVNDPTRGYGIFIENMLEH